MARNKAVFENSPLVAGKVADTALSFLLEFDSVLECPQGEASPSVSSASVGPLR